MDEEETPMLLIEKAIARVKDEGNTREAALVITKLQEAKLWYGEHLRAMRNAAKAAGHTSQALNT
jgi:hypothetical protein